MRYRAASADQKESLTRVTEALIPYRTEDAERAA